MKRVEETICGFCGLKFLGRNLGISGEFTAVLGNFNENLKLVTLKCKKYPKDIEMAMCREMQIVLHFFVVSNLSDFNQHLINFPFLNGHILGVLKEISLC